MTLDEAYDRLKLRPALEFESDQIALQRAVIPSQRLRGIGTTTRMLVEATLDVVDRMSILVYQPTQKHVRDTRTKLQEMAKVLGATGNFTWDIDVQITGSILRADSPHKVAYTDHWRDILDQVDIRVPGPLGWARKAQRNILHTDYDVFDRDGRFIAIITESGLAELKRRHHTNIFCP